MSMLGRITWWRMTADFTCTKCGYVWHKITRKKDVVFPHIPFAYVDAGDPYLVRLEKKTCSMKPSRCPNESCDVVNSNYEVTVPLEQMIPGTDELKKLLRALEYDANRISEEHREQLDKEIKAILAMIPENSELVFDGGKAVLVNKQ